MVIPPASHQVANVGKLSRRTWVGISITVGAVGLFGFLYTLLSKFVPLVSMWEYKEGEHSEGIERIGGGEAAGDGAGGGNRVTWQTRRFWGYSKTSRTRRRR